jgi:prophage maintenance system killer protein
MHYLSVHDLVWINAIVTGKTLTFDYAKLEAAMAAQYSYGDSGNVPVQAANLLESLILNPPFEYGNRRAAFIAVTTFLSANGRALKVGDEQAADIIRRVAARETAPADAVAALTAPADIGLRPGVTLRQLVTHLCNEHPDALKRLAEGDDCSHA